MGLLLELELSCRYLNWNCGKHERSSQTARFNSFQEMIFINFVGWSFVRLITQIIQFNVQTKTQWSLIFFVRNGFWISAIICSTHKLDMPINANEMRCCFCCVYVCVWVFFSYTTETNWWECCHNYEPSLRVNTCL